MSPSSRVELLGGLLELTRPLHYWGAELPSGLLGVDDALLNGVKLFLRLNF
jgi:uncharacterized heparinase superfamily protein